MSPPKLPGGDYSSAGATSLDHFDVCAVTWRLRERRVAGDDRRIECFRQGHVHGIVRRDVLAQFPCASEKIEMGMTVEIQVAKIGNRFGRPIS